MGATIKIQQHRNSFDQLFQQKKCTVINWIELPLCTAISLLENLKRTFWANESTTAMSLVCIGVYQLYNKAYCFEVEECLVNAGLHMSRTATCSGKICPSPSERDKNKLGKWKFFEVRINTASLDENSLLLGLPHWKGVASYAKTYSGCGFTKIFNSWCQTDIWIRSF